MIGGTLTAVALLPVGILMGWDSSFSVGAVFWAAAIFAALLLTVLGCFRLRYELVGTANPPLQATAAAPRS